MRHCPKVYFPDTKKSIRRKVGSTKIKIPYQTGKNKAKLKNNLKIITKQATPIITPDSIEKIVKEQENLN